MISSIQSNLDRASLEDPPMGPAGRAVTPPPSEQRIAAVYRSIQRCTSAQFSKEQVASFCIRADQCTAEEIIKIPREDKADKNDRSILADSTRAFLMLTHLRKGKDRGFGEGSSKVAKLCVDLRSGKIKVITIVKPDGKKKLTPEQWEKQKISLMNELEMMKLCEGIEEVVQLDFGYVYKPDASKKPDTSKEKVYFVLECCEGGDLFEAIKNSKLVNTEQKHAFIGEIAKGLHSMHERGILHRDLKPENIYIKGGHAKIGDLGFACLKDSPATLTACGSLEYTAPELFKRERMTDKADAWSAGVIFFEILTNEPFLPEGVESARNISQEMINLRIQSAINCNYLDPKYGPLLLGLLSQDPVARWDIKHFLAEYSKL